MSFRSFNAYLLTLSIAACGTANAPIEKSSAKATSQSDDKAAAQAALATLTNNSMSLCQPSKGSGLSCFAMGRTDSSGKLWVSAQPVAGYGASDLQAAYQIPNGGAGVTVALIEYGDYPNAEDDLAVYRSANALKACTTANGCFRKVNEAGQLLLPPATYNNPSSQPASAPVEDDNWSLETALDLDMVSAACPKCNILLVEATEQLATYEGYQYYTYVFDDAGQSVNTAVALGATAISNSYGFPEGASLIADAEANYFNHPGVSIFASTGDSGFGVFYPSTSQYVIAVGGTNLARSPNSTRGWNETAWNDGSSGCSAYVTKPSWQTDAGCPNRLTADLSAVGDPQTGVAVYGPAFYSFDGENLIVQSGWVIVGGTSVSSPLTAGIWAATGLAGSNAAVAYAVPQDFYDVNEGANGLCNTPYLYECTAEDGFDGPTGNGTPNGAALASYASTPACATDADCLAVNSGARPVCATFSNASQNFCAACAWDDFGVCQAGQKCIANSCQGTPTPAACMSNADCAAPTPACITFPDSSQNFCAGCGTAADCASGQKCIANTCQGVPN